ncbi:hypothetical protein MHM39_07825 [Phaeobacter sp. CNT1-3]|nr:hypothetical protein [Phaeobacter sp. CNT1-3]
MALVRTYLAVMLALVMVLTTQTMGNARHAAMPVGEMVLCIGSEAITVYYDEDGQPVDPPHYCPDCSASIVALAQPGFAPNLRPLGKGVALRVERGKGVTVTRIIPASARSPPVFS